jgi:glycosyltransferase involved in cell wall biosynthesis
MKIYFINYSYFADSSGIHLFFLANELESLGVKCIVCVPKKTSSVLNFGTPLFKTISYTQAIIEFILYRVRGESENVLIHAWTPREKVRRLTTFIKKIFDTPYCVHLEDNEENIFSQHTGIPYKTAKTISKLRRMLLPTSLVHPNLYESFINYSNGVSCIIDSLKSFIPKFIPASVFWPACEDEFFTMSSEPNDVFRKKLGINKDETVITYTGNIHKANDSEIKELFQAIILLNKWGMKTKIIHVGSQFSILDASVLNELQPFLIKIGRKPPILLIHYISAADILIQPGTPNEFNDYRFPSKLPMFLASGKPVILPLSNIGYYLQDNKNCLLLQNGTAVEIAEKVKILQNNPKHAQKIGAEGRKFAQIHFNWKKSAQQLLLFYNNILGNEIASPPNSKSN